MGTSANKHGPARDAEGAVCKTACEKLPDSVSPGAVEAPVAGAPPGNDGRDDKGRFGPGNHVGQRFQPGNQAAFKTGVRAFQARGVAALPEDLRQNQAEFRDGIVSDRGGLANMTTLEGAYVRKLVDVEIISRLLANDMVQRGVFTERGRVRVVFSRWLEALSVWDKFAQRIGTERRAKPTPTLQDYLDARRSASEPALTNANADEDDEPEGAA